LPRLATSAYELRQRKQTARQSSAGGCTRHRGEGPLRLRVQSARGRGRAEDPAGRRALAGEGGTAARPRLKRPSAQELDGDDRAAYSPVALRTNVPAVVHVGAEDVWPSAERGDRVAHARVSAVVRVTRKRRMHRAGRAAQLLLDGGRDAEILRPPCIAAPQRRP